MLPGVVFLLSLLSVPLARGNLLRLADVRLRCGWALLVAIGIQILIISVFPDRLVVLHPYAHVGSYFFAGLFLVANRNIPGLWLIGLGGAMNLAAIITNGGTMPASASALSTAGLLSERPGEFENSTTLGDPNLAFLGDVFAIPDAIPFANIFSLGDLCIVLGAFLVLHRVCASRLIPSGEGDFAALRRHPGFMRVWTAQAASNIGDYVYALAVVVTLTQQGVGPQVLATLILVQVGPAALTGLLGAPLIDRLPRKRLMVGADLCRACAVGTLLVTGSPSLGHFYVVGAVLGVGGAMFQPSLQASLPNLVPRGLLVAANSLVTATFHIAVMAGPVIGATLAAQVSPDSAFTFNALSFLFSAALMTRVVIAHVPVKRPARMRHDLLEGFRYALRTPVIRGILLMIGVAMFAASLRTPLDPIFILKTLGSRPESLGFTEAAWGFGMLLGSIAAPAVARRWLRPKIMSAGFAMIGAAVFVASQATTMAAVLVLWLLAGAGNALATVSYESLLQEGTPDRLRGRVVSASEAILDIALIAGALMAGVLAGSIGIRATYMVSGSIFLAVGAFGHLVLAPPRPAAGHRLGRRRAAPRWGSASFEPAFFDRLRLDSDHALLLVGGRWVAPAGGPATAPSLVMDDGGSLRRLLATGDPFPCRRAGPEASTPWSSAFLVPGDRLQGGPHGFALQTGDGALAYLPEPAERSISALAPVEREAAIDLLEHARRAAPVQRGPAEEGIPAMREADPRLRLEGA